MLDPRQPPTRAANVPPGLSDPPRPRATVKKLLAKTTRRRRLTLKLLAAVILVIMGIMVFAGGVSPQGLVGATEGALIAGALMALWLLFPTWLWVRSGSRDARRLLRDGSLGFARVSEIRTVSVAGNPLMLTTFCFAHGGTQHSVHVQVPGQLPGFDVGTECCLVLDSAHPERAAVHLPDETWVVGDIRNNPA